VTAATPGLRDSRAWLALTALVVIGVGIRVPALAVEGHIGDVLVVSRWAERMADVGPLHYYEGGGSIYPALLYLYWPLGAMFDGAALDTAIEALSIPFDVALGILLFVMTATRAGAWAGVGAAGLYLLNPAVILAGPVWGQIDAAGTLAMLATLLAAAHGRLGLAAGLAVVAGLVKPQFGLLLLPVLVLALMAARRERSLWPAAWTLTGIVAAYLLIAGPLLLSPIEHAGNIANETEIRTEASVHAPNMWALAFGYDRPDTGYGGIALALLAGGLLAAQLPLRRGRDLRTLLVVGTFVIFAFYFLPTRVHERYLFPAMAVLAPLAAVSRPVLAGYLALAAGFTLSLLYALADTTPFTLPQEWEQVLITREMMSGLSILMVLAAITLVVQLWDGAGKRLGASAPRG
jgi:Gpi18-like mannosyltransferase